MVWHIVRKELLVNVLSVRFMIGLVMTTVLMGLVGYVLTEEFIVRRQTYLSDIERHHWELSQTKVFSMVRVTVDMPPSPLSVFSRGNRDVPSSVSVSPYHIPSLIDETGGTESINLSGSSDRPHNPLLRVFGSIDLTFVISSLMSLFAIILVFDSFSGEREQGTLKIVLSTSVGRIQLLIGKFLGALISLAVPLTIGFLEIVLIWTLSPNLSFDGSALAGMTIIYFAALAFLSSFLAFSLTVSLYARESSSGLMWLLIGWVVLAIVIPEGGGYLAEYFRPKEIRARVLAEAEQARRDLDQASSKLLPYRQKTGWNNASISATGGESIFGITLDEVPDRIRYNEQIFPLKVRYAEERYRVTESYSVVLRSWNQVRDNIVRPSLCVLFKNIAESVAGSDLETSERTFEQARAYRDALMKYLSPKVETAEWFTRVREYPEAQPTEENRSKWQALIEKEGERAVERIMSWDRIQPLDLSGLPAPSIGLATVTERFVHAAMDGIFLLASVGLFLAWSMWRVVRYPVH
jgi:ABC-type transport system involved in multi-copper enzyme maturation permease subunit